MNNTIITNKTALQTALVNCTRFTVQNSLNKDKIGESDFTAWKTLVSSIQPSAYKVYEAKANHATKAEKQALMSDVINAVKPVLKEMGTIYLYDATGVAHESTITIDDDFIESLADVCTMFAGKSGKTETPRLQLVRSQLSNTNRLIRDYEGKNGVNPDTITRLKEEAANYEAEIKHLMSIADESKPTPVPAGDSSFRKQFEIHMGRTISNQKAKSWEEYEAEKEAKRAERREKNKAKKAAQKNSK